MCASVYALNEKYSWKIKSTHETINVVVVLLHFSSCIRANLVKDTELRATEELSLSSQVRCTNRLKTWWYFMTPHSDPINYNNLRSLSRTTFAQLQVERHFNICRLVQTCIRLLFLLAAEVLFFVPIM